MSQFIHSLEQRRMLAAAVADGVLTITGTDNRDAINVSLSSDGETIKVRETTTTASTSRFRRPTSTTTTTEFELADVTSIVINAGAGDDEVSLRGTRDTALEVAASINGEDGNDRLRGAAGNDTISGGAGDDDLYGGGGTDSLSGGDGEDLLAGGDDVDTLNGDADDDLILSAGDDAIDVIDGGEDSAADGEDDEDLAVVDDDETPTGVTVVDEGDIFIPHFHGPAHFGGMGFGPRGGHGHR